MPLSTLWAASRPLVIAHRGASRRAPENTLAAFRLAADLGADATELDVKLTADGQVVVMHDQTLDRTTDGSGRVADHTLADIKALEAGAHFSPQFAGEPVPTLEEVFQAIGSRLLVNVELGNYATPRDRLPEATVEVVRRCGMHERVVLSSFNPVALRRARAADPAIAVGLLLMPRQPAWQRLLFYWLAPKDFLHLNEALISPRAVSGQARAGRPVIAWTVNDPKRIEELLRIGVHGVISDEPDVARSVVQRVG
ncbi:MAG: glycerophosphodiester phosphodiesterase family protein [Chloroflexota bacterium]